MLGLLRVARNAIWPHPFKFTLEYAEATDSGSNPIVDMIRTHCPDLSGANAPPQPTRWLPSGHAQTMYSAVGDFSKVDEVEYKRKVFLTPDGGTVAVDIEDQDGASVPTVVILHGLTGGSYESYVRNCVARLSKPKAEGGYGFRCVVVNSRGCANTPVTSAQLYSASKTADLESSLLLLTNMFPSSPMIGMGFSLGGAILSKYFGEVGKKTPFIGGVAVGTPFSLEETSMALESSYMSLVYSYAMGRNLMNLLRRHVDTLSLWPEFWEPLETVFGEKISPKKDAPVAEPAKDGPPKGRIRFVDHYAVRHVGGLRSPYGEFPLESALAYYRHASATKYLTNIARPLLAVNADDDPIVPAHALATLRKELKSNPNVVLAHTQCGGHLGWFATSAGTRWVHNPVNQYISALFERFAAPDCPHGATGLGSGGPSATRWKQSTVDKQKVNVELLPASALPNVLPGVTSKTHEKEDVPQESKGEPMHAWLLTQILQHLPLVHPKDSPIRLAQENPEPIEQGEVLRLTLYHDALRPEIGYIELPEDVNVGGNGSLIQGSVSGKEGLAEGSGAKIAGL